MEAEKLLDDKRESSCAIYMHYFFGVFLSFLFLFHLCFIFAVSQTLFLFHDSYLIFHFSSSSPLSHSAQLLNK